MEENRGKSEDAGKETAPGQVKEPGEPAEGKGEPPPVVDNTLPGDLDDDEDEADEAE